MVPPPLATGLGGHGPARSSPALGQPQSSGRVTSVYTGVTQGHSCMDRGWHRGEALRAGISVPTWQQHPPRQDAMCSLGSCIVWVTAPMRDAEPWYPPGSELACPALPRASLTTSRALSVLSSGAGLAGTGPGAGREQMEQRGGGCGGCGGRKPGAAGAAEAVA